MKLSILVTRYKESWDVCHFLFDSIALQQGIDFNDIEVVVVNDGREKLLDDSVFKGYPYTVKYLNKNHGGVSAARNYAFDNSSGEYVIFCDCDDMFLNNYGLHMLFSAMGEGFDTLASSFVEEVKEGDSFKIVRHDKDATFIHGKVHSREYLTRENIRFNEDLTIHEDGYFVSMAQTFTDKRRMIETPFYLWKWNPNSIVRRGTDNPTIYVYKTYRNVMDCRIAMCKELLERGAVNEFYDCVVKTVMDAYYDFQKPDALLKENKKLVASAEKEFKRFWEQYGEYYKESNINRIAEITDIARLMARTKGFRLESKPVAAWLNHINVEV